MLSTRYLIGFTGHRANFDESSVAAALREVLADLQRQARECGGEVEIYGSAAEGTDTVCLEVARELGIPVHLLLPLDEDEFAKDFSSPAAWERSRVQLECARRLPGRDSVHSVPGETARPDCYFNQGMRMLDAVDVVVAVWDEEPARGLGGTAQVVEQAGNGGKPVILISPATGEITPAKSGGPVFRPDPLLEELNTLAKEAKVPCAAHEVETPDHLQACLDAIAVQEAAKFRPSLVRIILLHGLAALLAALVTYKGAQGTVWDLHKWVVTLCELGLVSVALWMSYRLHRRHIQQRWIRCRFACELVRGLRASIPILNPLHPIITPHEPDWARFALSAGLLVLRNQDTMDSIVLRDRYVETRLSATHPDGQIRHYQLMRPSALWWWTFTGWVSHWSALLAPAFVFMSLINKLSKHWSPPDGLGMEKRFWPWLVVVFFPIALPLLAGVAASLRHALDAGRRKERYPQAVARLEAVRSILPGMRTPSTIHAQVMRSEELLLDELLEWQLAMKNTGH